MALAKEQFHTVDDIYDLPEGNRAELIDGQIYMMAPPTRQHQDISGGLYTEIRNYITQKAGACKVYAAPFAVFLNDDDRNYVEPDISVVCDPGKLTDSGCSGAPDWIIEIVSPSSRRMDYYVKLFKYRSAGVKEYWIVDPATKNVRVYDFVGGDTSDHPFSEPIKVGIYPDLLISLSDLLL